MGKAARNRRVFINCPFDKNYKPIFNAIVFTLHHLGYEAQYALHKSGGGSARLTRIYRQLCDCASSIHDISRVSLSGPLRLPRFNMPFEAGLAYAIHASARPGHRHDLLFLDAKAYRYQASISDVAGLDPKIHYNDPVKVIAEVRTFFRQHYPHIRYDDAPYIQRWYLTFLKHLEAVARTKKNKLSHLQSWDYALDLQTLMVLWIRAANRAATRAAKKAPSNK